MKPGKRLASLLVEVTVVAACIACISSSAELTGIRTGRSVESDMNNVTIEASYGFASGYYRIPLPNQVGQEFIPSWTNLDW